MRFALFTLGAVALALASTTATALSISPYSATSDDSYVSVISHEDLNAAHSHSFVEHEAEAEAEAEAEVEAESEQAPTDNAIRVNIDDLPAPLAAKAFKLQAQVDAEAAASEGTFPEGRKVQWEVVFDGADKARSSFLETEVEAENPSNNLKVKTEEPRSIHVHVDTPKVKSATTPDVTDSLNKSLAKMQKTSSKILKKMISVISKLHDKSQGRKDAALIAIATEKNPMKRKRDAEKAKKKAEKKNKKKGKKGKKGKKAEPRKRCRSLKGKAHAGLLTEADKKDWVSAAYHPAPGAPAAPAAPAVPAAAGAPTPAPGTFITPQTK